MAMWYKLTPTIRRQKRDSKSLYYVFFRPRGRFVFQSKISGKCFEIHILYLLFYRTYLPYFSLFQAFSPVSPRSPPFELLALLSERVEHANHILFTSLSLCHQDQPAVYNVHEFEFRCDSVKSQVSFFTFITSEDLCWNIRNVKLKFHFFPEIRLYFLMWHCSLLVVSS